MNLLRRHALLASSAALMWGGHMPAAHALAWRELHFPRDFGAHPEHRTEWWYITGHAQSRGRVFGFQVTFFRARVDAAQSLQSALAARQLVFAHAAVTDLQGRKLWHDQRIARVVPGLAQADERDTRVMLRDWTLQREGPADGGRYTARIAAQDFALDLRFDSTQPLLLQGREGLSRKGPEASQASYYYSRPHLLAGGSITVQRERFAINGTAWLDHEWSETLMHPEAVGWDWIGMNLFDGSALTAFRLRRKDGSTLWDGGSFRSAPTSGSRLRVAAPGETVFRPGRLWKSPVSQASYPVEWAVRTPAGEFTVRALLDAQELDSRRSTGAIYWEGLSDLLDASGRVVGRGYLEMTGYASPLQI